MSAILSEPFFWAFAVAVLVIAFLTFFACVMAGRADDLIDQREQARREKAREDVSLPERERIEALRRISSGGWRRP